MKNYEVIKGMTLHDLADFIFNGCWGEKRATITKQDLIEWLKEENGISPKDDVEEDACEWIGYDYRTLAPRWHDEGQPYWRIPDNMDKLKYCPYCGKKIVLIE